MGNSVCAGKNRSAISKSEFAYRTNGVVPVPRTCGSQNTETIHRNSIAGNGGGAVIDRSPHHVEECGKHTRVHEDDRSDLAEMAEAVASSNIFRAQTTQAGDDEAHQVASVPADSVTGQIRSASRIIVSRPCAIGECAHVPPSPPGLSQLRIENGTVTKAELARYIAEDTQHHVVVLIDGNLYDVSSYAKSHPGGSRVLRGYNGKDSSKAFARIHGKRAKELAKKFYVAPLRQEGVAAVTMSHTGAVPMTAKARCATCLPIGNNNGIGTSNANSSDGKLGCNTNDNLLVSVPGGRVACAPHEQLSGSAAEASNVAQSRVDSLPGATATTVDELSPAEQRLQSARLIRREHCSVNSDLHYLTFAIPDALPLQPGGSIQIHIPGDPREGRYYTPYANEPGSFSICIKCCGPHGMSSAICSLRDGAEVYIRGPYTPQWMAQRDARLGHLFKSTIAASQADELCCGCPNTHSPTSLPLTGGAPAESSRRNLCPMDSPTRCLPGRATSGCVDTHVLFMGGGTGVVPLYSMIRHLLRYTTRASRVSQPCSLLLTFFCFFRTRDDLILPNELRALAREFVPGSLNGMGSARLHDAEAAQQNLTRLPNARTDAKDTTQDRAMTDLGVYSPPHSASGELLPAPARPTSHDTNDAHDATHHRAELAMYIALTRETEDVSIPWATATLHGRVSVRQLCETHVSVAQTAVLCGPSGFVANAREAVVEVGICTRGNVHAL